jgi:glycine/D-amino acid oxidase-like deaminating enzyme
VRGLYQAAGGLIDARKANAMHATLARARGATILEGTTVRALRVAGERVEVETDGAAILPRGWWWRRTPGRTASWGPWACAGR